MDGFAYVQSWYRSNCDGEWEHEFGIRIVTLDNPGWSMEIDLTETSAEGFTVDRAKRSTGEGSWVWTSSDGVRFSASCDPGSLDVAGSLFKEFVAAAESARQDKV